MTLEQFRLLRPGDVVLDLAHGRARRKIHEIRKHRGKHTQRGLTRYSLVVDNLKQSGQTTIIFVSENTGPVRFELAAKRSEAA